MRKWIVFNLVSLLLAAPFATSRAETILVPAQDDEFGGGVPSIYRKECHDGWCEIEVSGNSPTLNTETPKEGTEPKPTRLAVDFFPKTFEQCESAITTKISIAAGVAQVPGGETPATYCRKLFPATGSAQGGEVGTGADAPTKVRVPVMFSFPSRDTCVDSLSHKVPPIPAKPLYIGTAEEDPEKAAQQFCKAMFPPLPPHHPVGVKPAPCESLSLDHNYYCIDSNHRPRNLGDRGWDTPEFRGYTHPDHGISEASCTSWCGGYGEEGACSYTVSQLPGSDAITCTFWPRRLCTDAADSDLEQVNVASHPEAPVKVQGAYCKK